MISMTRTNIGAVALMLACSGTSGAAQDVPAAAAAPALLASAAPAAPASGTATAPGDTAAQRDAGTSVATSSATGTGQPATALNAPRRPAAALQRAPTETEAQYGIQVTQVDLLAAGGLVDLRLKILDAAKASKLLGNPSRLPVLIVGDEPPLHAPHHSLKGARFGNGLVYFLLYPNVRGVVRTGAEVTVALGDVRLGPVVVQ